MKLLQDRYYDSPVGSSIQIKVRPRAAVSWTHVAADFEININNRKISQPIWYSHLSLMALLQENFHSVLDLGSNDGMVSHIFKFMGKDVVALEPGVPHQNDSQFDIYPPDVEKDYLETSFSKKFDAIWCSHVLEHMRNPGFFLDKIFDDLKEGGVLALTVPFNDFGSDMFNFCLGHHNRYNHALLIYQLVCAGFDCREISCAVYLGQIGIILKKKSNRLTRISSGMTDGERIWDGDRKLTEFFPFKVDSGGGRTDQALINWHYPY